MPSPSTLGSVVLALTTLVFLGLGLAFLVAPVPIAAAVDLDLDSATSRTEIRAIYGGLEIGVALFLALCLLRGEVRLGLLAGACLLLGAGAGRLLGMAFEGVAESPMPLLVASELVGGVLCLLAARLHAKEVSVAAPG